MRNILYTVSLLLLIPFLADAASFRPWDISSDNKLLFTARTKQPGWNAYQTALIADIDNDDSISFLTHFPESAVWYQSTEELEVFNRFGLFRFRTNEDGAEFRRLPFIPGISEQGIPEGQILAASPSPDGRWVLVQEATGPIRGNLVLYDIQKSSNRTSKAFLISRNHIFEYYSSSKEMFRNSGDRVEKYNTLCGLWSPDSRYVLYSNGGRLYYVSVHSITSLPTDVSGNLKIPDESFREFGRGNLASVRWLNNNTVYGIFDSVVVQFRPAELLMLTWYSTPLPNSNIVGRLPIEFNPNFDQFWPSPDGKSLLVLKNGQTLFHFPLGLSNDTHGGQPFNMPFLVLQENKTLLQLWWRDNGELFLLTGASRRWKPALSSSRGKSASGTAQNQLYMYKGQQSDSHFEATGIVDIRRFVPSPDGSVIAILNDRGVEFRKSNGLKIAARRIEHRNPRDLLWMDKDRFIILGEHKIVSIDLKRRTQRLLGLSQADQIGYDSSGNIVAVSNEVPYQWNPRTHSWREEVNDSFLRSPTLSSPSMRIYEAKLNASSYTNQIMIRTVNGFGNRALLKIPQTRTRLLPNADDKLQSAYDSRVFDHGSRVLSRKEVALVFNAIDNSNGLGEVLNVLADYDIQATFFVSGDFIRQNPESTRLLASSNHEIGSLFYTHLDMSDYLYRIDDDFVVRGLGRNEDEYFDTTGAEINTLWHAPWYVTGPAVMDATQRMNYLYVGRDVDPLDWVTLDAPKGTRDLYKKSANLVEQVLDEVQTGSIIPVRIGKPGNREDYFFQDIDILINALLREGYTIVTAGLLKAHSR